MAELKHELSLAYGSDAPTFVDRDRLLALDAIFHEHKKRLDDLTNKELQEEIDAIKKEVQEDRDKSVLSPERVQEYEDAKVKIYTEFRDKRLAEYSVDIDFGGNKKLIAESFAEIIKHPAFLESAPLSFDAGIRGRGVRASVSTFPSGRLRVVASPSDSDTAKALFEDLYEWAMPLRAPGWQRFWLSAGRGFMWWPFACLVFSIPSLAENTSGIKALKAQAVQLLQNGIEPSEQKDAIEVLLRLSTTSATYEFPSWLGMALFISFILALVLSFPPPSILLGVGEGEEKIRYWRKRLHITFIAVPVFIFLTFIVPRLQKLVDSFF